MQLRDVVIVVTGGANRIGRGDVLPLGPRASATRDRSGSDALTNILAGERAKEKREAEKKKQPY